MIYLGDTGRAGSRTSWEENVNYGKRDSCVGESQGSGITYFFVKQAFELFRIFSRVFLPSIDDKRWVTEGPIAD